jgi:DNA-binding response OmpR family regulator
MIYLPKILIVDDEKDFLEVITVVLRDSGLDVYSISDSSEVFPIIKSFKPDVILLDVKLGQDNGCEICRDIKRNWETRNIKVLLHSAFTDVAWEWPRFGADGFMLKPYDLPDLLDNIKMLLPKQPE